MDISEIDREDFRRFLGEVGSVNMPFGKFGPGSHPPSGVALIDLPEEYLGWFKERGFPKGRLGELMAQVCDLKQIGMDWVFDPLREARGGRTRLTPRRGTRIFPEHSANSDAT